MSSSQKTPYYNLSQFQDTDKPSWRGDYNGDMSKIDTGMQEIKTSAIDAKTIAQNAESSINEVRRDYLTKTDAQDTYATKTALNDTKTTIENNADNKFVAKTVYDTAIANKADKTSVYTKTESDDKYRDKTDSYSKGETDSNFNTKIVHAQYHTAAGTQSVHWADSNTIVPINFNTELSGDFHNSADNSIMLQNQNDIKINKTGWYLISGHVVYGGLVTTSEYKPIHTRIMRGSPSPYDTVLADTAASMNVGGNSSTTGAAQKSIIPAQLHHLAAGDMVRMDCLIPDETTQNMSGLIRNAALNIVRLGE